MRQLEHRIRDLPDAPRPARRPRHAARKPAAAARQALAQPFKYADELHAATHRCATIAEQMTARQRDVNNDTWPPVATQARPQHGVDADTAEIRATDQRDRTVANLTLLSRRRPDQRHATSPRSELPCRGSGLPNVARDDLPPPGLRANRTPATRL